MPLGGRKVRCSSCSNVWFATADQDEAVAADKEFEDETVKGPVTEETADKLDAIRAAMVEDAAHIDDDDYDEDLADEEKLNIEEEADAFDINDVEPADAVPDVDIDEDIIPAAELDEDIAIEGGVTDSKEIDERFADDDLEDDDFPSDDNFDEGDDEFPLDDITDDDFDDDDVLARRRRRQREEAEYRASSKKAQMAAIGWVFLFMFFAAIAGLFFMVPEKIVSWWPAAEGIYDTVGVTSKPKPVHAAVVEIPKVRITPYASTMIADGDSYKLTLSGKIVNEGLRSITIPAITFKLINAQGNEISKGSFCLPNRILRKSQSVEFEHIINPASVETAKADFEIKWEKDKKGVMIDSCASKVSG